MAATAHAMPNIDIRTVDEMDMYSDSGLDFGDGDGDGDIDLDLEPVPLTQGEHDDDVSIIDAASDVEQTALSQQEQDDFMVDPEDAIEEDSIYHTGDDAIEIEQTSTDAVATLQSPICLQPDEDLIDYSDDEGEQILNVPTKSHENNVVDIQNKEADDNLCQHEKSPIREIDGDADVEHVDFLVQDDITGKGLGIDEVDDQQQSPEQSHAELTDHGDNKSAEGDEGGVFLYEQNDRNTTETADNEVHQPDSEPQDELEAQDDVVVNGPVDEDEDYEDKSLAELHSITVNYAGNELWLFKQHDPDDSGDWLLDDVSLLKSRISDVFSACRIALGDNVSNEHELGFRFDHLHNLELYEDNTACVAVSLEKLVDLYRTLQSQDGIHEPDSFYISFLSRPRFAAMLSEVAKFAENGHGYSALHAAVAAGETHFANVFSESPSEEVTEWDDEQPEDVVTNVQEDLTNGEFQQEEDQNDGISQQQQQQHEAIAHLNSAEDSLLQAYKNNDTVAPATDKSANASNAATEINEPASSLNNDVDQATAERVSEADARRAQEKDDLVDYSDDEGAGPAEQAKVSSPIPSSPSTFTVQSDEKLAVANDHVDFVSTPSENAQQTEFQINEEGSHHGEQPETGDHNVATQHSQQHVTQNYHDVDTGFAESKDEECDSNVDCQIEYDTNPDFATYDGQASEQQTQPDLTSESELYQEGGGLSLNDYTESDVFLDLDNASAWVIEREPYVNFPEDATFEQNDDDAVEGKEAGVAEQTSAAVPSDATVIAVSSSETKTMSPQGQKRSIDEAGHGVDDAFEPIDTKRPKV